MKRRTLLILENARKMKTSEDNFYKDSFNENISPNPSILKDTPDEEIIITNESRSSGRVETERRKILSPVNVISQESEPECESVGAKCLQDSISENISPNQSIIEDTPDREIITIKYQSRRSGRVETERRKILSPVNVISQESESECENNEPRTKQTYVRSSSVSSSTSNSSSKSSNSHSSTSSSNSSSTNQSKTDIPTSRTTVSTSQHLPSNSTSQYNRLVKENMPPYCVSPINELESDPDLSDDDPTYQTHNNIQNLSRSSSLSSSSIDSALSEPQLTMTDSNNTTATTSKNVKKRKRNPSNWKQNIIKKLRNTGQAYTSSSKSNREVPARSMKEPCACRLKCSDNISEVNRKDIFQSFWKLGSLELQRQFIKSCMTEIQPRYKYTNAQTPRLPNNAFYFTIEGTRIRICKKYFINTLDITDRQIRTVKQKANNTGFIAQEQRGKHDKRKKIDENVIQHIIDHINSIPRIESHYLRASTSREYIDGGRTLKDLWRDFSTIRQQQNQPPVQYWLYHNIFTTKFNIGFFQPKKDRCDFCLEFDLASLERKAELKENYDMHIKEKNLCRLEKKTDRSNISDENICTVYDLQAVMQCPNGEISSFYYLSKLNCLNFTMAELEKKATNQELEGVGAYGDVFCFFWDETQAKRGANEIGSCILDYLKKISEKSPDKTLNIIFYTDNCCGQNKNKYIACLYSYAVSHFSNINSITHKFFVKGHTQSEGDNVHSLIEKEIKKNLKSGPIYTPHEYVAIIKSAKKNGQPFKVQEVGYDFVLDLKSLQLQWGYNFSENDNKRPVIWNDIKVLKFMKTDPFVLFYRTSYTQETFERVDFRNKRKKMPALEDIVVNKAFKGKLKLTENKKKAINEMLRKNLIPSYYTDYYKTIISGD